VAYAHAGISRARLEEEIRQPQRTLALVFGLLLVVAVALATLFAFHTSRPLRRLTRAARTIADGNLESRVERLTGPAEIRTMARAFEEMRESLKMHMEQLERSYAELDRKVNDISILYQVSEQMNEGDYSERMLDTILSGAVSGVGAGFGAIFLREDESGTRLVASRGVNPQQGEDSHLGLLGEVAAQTILDQKRMLRESTESSGSQDEGELLVAGVPLLVREDTAGALTVGTRGRPFVKEDEKLLDALASHAARCVERTRLYTASITDGLTGLYVSRYFRRRLKEELRTGVRYQRAVSLLMVDIDYFKKVNDTYGHQAGDDVLRIVARCITATVREGIDVAARYGGEEFAVILPETPKEGARALAERLRELIGKQVISSGSHTVRVTASVGVATSPDDGVRPEAVVDKADKALYQAKRTGRNRVVVA